MKATLISFAALAAFGFAANASAQTVAPRQVTERVAVQVEQNFYDEARGAQIAAELRQNAAAGRYDSFTAPLDLATALTATLHPYDGHFRVEYAAAPPPGGPPAGPNNLARSIGADARGNYGFLHTEIFPGGVGYLDLRAFANFTPDNADTAPERRAADAAMTMLAGAEAIIIDMRECAGGSPAMVGYLVAHFVPVDANVYNTFHSRRGSGSEAPFVDPRVERRLTTPLYIVTSGRTGSACEAFAYTLKAAGRATIVGAASAGGANPGGYRPVGDGFSVFVSSGSPENPITHTNWEGTGVTPDVVTTAEAAVARARVIALEGLARGNGDAAHEANWALIALNAANAPYPTNLSDYAGDYGQRSVAIEGGRLVVHRERRPGLILLPVERDLFTIADAALPQQVRFERDNRGRVIAMVATTITGQQFRDPRAETR